MEGLKEMIHLVSKSKVKSINVIGDNSFNKGDKLSRLYTGILEGRFDTDEEAAAALGLDARNKQFQNLKSELRYRMLNTVFFIDIKKASYTDYQKAYLTIYKEWAAAKLLLAQRAKGVGVNLTKKILKKALKFELTELVLDAANVLRGYYGAVGANKRKFRYYDQIFVDNEPVWLAENKVHRMYLEITIEYRESNHGKAADLAKKYTEKILPLLEQYKSYHLHLMGRLIISWAYMLNYEYQETIKSCIEAIYFFDQKPYSANHAISIFLHNQLSCHTQLKDFDHGKLVAQRCKDLTVKGTFNWYKTEELLLILALHTRHFSEAIEIYYHAINQPRYKFLPPSAKELWEIYGMYIHYATVVHNIEVKNAKHRVSRVRLGKFLNTVPKHTMEKRRMNIPILIIHILFLIFQNKYGKVMNRIEAIEKYCSRYLQADTHYRSNCFIRMLLQIPRSDFHVKAVERNARKYWQKLQQSPLETANQTHEIEIIPYEELWAYVLQSLENRRNRIREFGVDYGG
ncbi:MAG: hypothetical protein AAFP19_17250 [Bacteroidota bacterium]